MHSLLLHVTTTSQFWGTRQANIPNNENPPWTNNIHHREWIMFYWLWCHDVLVQMPVVFGKCQKITSTYLYWISLHKVETPTWLRMGKVVHQYYSYILYFTYAIIIMIVTHWVVRLTRIDESSRGHWSSNVDTMQPLKLKRTLTALYPGNMLNKHTFCWLPEDPIEIPYDI